MSRPTVNLPRLIAHRGLSAHAPENTLTAVRAAHADGCGWVELDVQLLGDGTPVIWHDKGVRRCSNSRGKLANMELPRARALDVGAWFGRNFAGERMATLDEMLALIDELGLGLNLELKVHRGRDPQALVATALPRALDALPPERLIVSSFHPAALEAARALQPDGDELHLGILHEKPSKEWQRNAEALKAFSLHVDWRRLKEKRAREIKAAGYALLCYTPNDPVAFATQWDWGVDSAISDDPGLFTHYLPEAEPPDGASAVIAR